MRRAAFYPTLFATFLITQSSALSAVRVPSPSGRWEFAFERPAHSTARDPDESSPTTRISNVEYLATFYHPGSATAAAQTPFFDVYPSTGSKPTNPATLAAALLWSPQEDFAVLPKEQWPKGAGPPGHPLRQAVSLNTSYAWQTAAFPLDSRPLVWLDPLHVAGNVVDGCRRDVAVFDGSAGRAAPLIPGSSDSGYAIWKSESKRLVLKRAPSPCAEKAISAAEQPQCMSYDFSFQRAAVSACE